MRIRIKVKAFQILWKTYIDLRSLANLKHSKFEENNGLEYHSKTAESQK